jgi:dTDP-4-amino-4,6-dideoxygalactose transaminase
MSGERILVIDDDNNKSAEELKLIVAKRFQFVTIGHSFRVTELEAALGLAQLEDWESNVTSRRKNAAALLKKLAPLQDHLQLPRVRPGSDHSFMMFPVVTKKQPKKDLVNFLEQNGVETRDMLPLTNQPAHQRILGWREADYPNAQWINNNGFYVASHQNLSEDEIDYIADSFTQFFRS